MSSDLKICFGLLDRETRQFLTELEIVQNIPYVVERVKNESIWLSIPDGFVSIKYRGQELLGRSHWGDVYNIINMFYGLDKLYHGMEVKEVLSLHSLILTFRMKDDFIEYNLRSSPVRSESLTIQKYIPANLFLKEFIRFCLRASRVLQEIGSHFKQIGDEDLKDDEVASEDFGFILDKWTEYIPDNLFTDSEVEEIKRDILTPVSGWVLRTGC